ncbi:MAG: hypothetical protein ACYCX4_06140 [Bacillota bacterium]
MNRIIRQGLDLFQGFVALPFEAIHRNWRDDNTPTTQAIKRTAAFAEGLVTLPFKAARDFFEEDPPSQGNQGFQGNQDQGSQAQGNQGYQQPSCPEGNIDVNFRQQPS